MNISKVKVENMESPRTGAPVANQFIITVLNDDGTKTKYFQSYRTIIAFENPHGNFVLDAQNWDYSITTLKYLGRFLGGYNKKEIEKGIKDGSYQTADLN